MQSLRNSHHTVLQTPESHSTVLALRLSCNMKIPYEDAVLEAAVSSVKKCFRVDFSSSIIKITMMLTNVSS